MSSAGLDDHDLREAFASMTELRGDGSECPAPDTLWSSGRAELDPEENESVLLHLGTCTACATAWRIAHDLAKDGALKDSPVYRERRSGPGWLPRALAAAAAIALVGLALWLYRGPSVPEPSLRNQESGAIQPRTADGIELPRTEFLLRWQPGPEGTTYDVRVTTEDLGVVASTTGIAEPEFLVPESALEGLSPGEAVFWQVTARLPDGRRIDSESLRAVLAAAPF